MVKPRIKLKSKKTNIFRLVNAKMPSKDIIDLCEYALREAESGDICAVVISKVYFDGHYDFVYSGMHDPHLPKMLAALDMAKLDATLIALSQDSGSFLHQLVSQ